MEEIVFLALTIAIELPVAIALLRRHIPWKRVAIVVVCVNMITHPIGWYVISAGGSWGAVEIGVTIFEALVFAGMFSSRLRAVIAACVMNGISAALGALLS